MPQERYATVNTPAEWPFESALYADPFNEIELDVVFTTPAGHKLTVPAYWSGGGEWRVRFAPAEPGTYTWRTVCTDEEGDLHGLEGTLHSTPYEGDNPLLVHGQVQISTDGRHLEHADGTPFFWLGDTWWTALSRLGWPADFQSLTADRVAKGFSVIQLVAGLFPDMPPFDPRGASEAGQAWEDNWARVNTAWFDLADLKIQWLVRSGLVPCILGCWGYYLPFMGIDAMKRHWRYIVARYSAWPVVWCLAGEGSMPWYLSETKDNDKARQKLGWSELGRYVQQIDPYDHPVTIHPITCARDTVDDESVLDFDMLQTGHSGRESVPNTVETVRREIAREPAMPVVQGEVCYEGILGESWEDVQRFMFWSCMLSGTAGFTYGANGIWQFNGRGVPYGPSPWGGAWGNRPWEEACNLPGSTQVGVGRRILERFEWWRFEPHQEWVSPGADANDYRAPYAAGIPGEVRVIYLARPIFPWDPRNPVVKDFEEGVAYRASAVDPRDGSVTHLGRVEPDANGEWRVPLLPVVEDYVVVLEKDEPSDDIAPAGPIMFA